MRDQAWLIFHCKMDSLKNTDPKVMSGRSCKLDGDHQAFKELGEGA